MMKKRDEGETERIETPVSRGVELRTVVWKGGIEGESPIEMSPDRE